MERGMEEKETLIFSSIWNRNRMVFRSENIDQANELFFNATCFIPQYRQLIFCGDIPKELRYTKGAKLLETKDLESLRDAFQGSLAEEEMGTPPVQIVYFNAEERVFNNILRYLDRGWIATTSRDKSILEKQEFNIYLQIELEEGVIYLLDPAVADTSIEEEILENTNNNSSGIRTFMAQMKENQVHYAFQAILDELGTGEKITQAFLSESLDVRQKTIEKIIEIGKRERRFDISNYIEESPPPVVKFLKDLSSIREISLAAVFDRRDLIGYAKYRDVVFPTGNFLRLNDAIEHPSGSKFNIRKPWHFELNAKFRDIIIFNNDYLYCFILEKGMNFEEFQSRLKKLLRSLKDGIDEANVQEVSAEK
jgi:hypothetical protein